MVATIPSGTSTRTITYAYDGLAGNRTGATVNGVTMSRISNAANLALGWSYGAAGNLLSGGTTTSAGISAWSGAGRRWRG